MSAAACGALQLKIQQLEHAGGEPSPGRGACLCGTPESLFPIPLVESYRNVIRLYYGKTLHDETGSQAVGEPFR